MKHAELVRSSVSAPGAVALTFCLVASCAGSIDGHDPEIVPGGTGTPSGSQAPGGGGAVVGPPPPVDVEACSAGGRRIGAAPVRRLTHTEWANTVRDLFNDATASANGLPAEGAVGDEFSTAAEHLVVSPLLGEAYLVESRKIAASAVRNLSTLLPCNPAGAAEEACVRQFVEQFGKRAYRRPLAAEEITSLLSLFKAVRTTGKADLAGALTDLIETMLGSPHFLYRLELSGSGAPGTAVALSQHEIAARLSYTFWATMPDKELFAAADAGQLATADQIAAQARRLLASPRSRDAVDAFFAEWVRVTRVEGLDKDAKLFPEFGPALKAAMKRETAMFVNHVLRERDAQLATLLTLPVSFVDGALAKLYGVANVSGSEFRQVSLDPAQRAGLLTQPSVLAVTAGLAQSDPIRRGKLVRMQMLCQHLPDPPPGVAGFPPPSATQTTRQLLEQHRSDPTCSGCHSLLDPIGFGLESYDAVGRWRTMEGRLPVDNQGELTATRDVDGKFRGGPELARKLAGSGEARDCVATQVFRYALGRSETPDDKCSLGVAQELFKAKNGNLLELFVAMTQTDAFVYRSAGGAP